VIKARRTGTCQARFVIVQLAIGERRFSFQQLLDPALDHELLDLGDRLGRVEPLRAGDGAIQDRVWALPTKVSTCTGRWRPPIPSDDVQCDVSWR
jgi:hypothetical protein